MLEFAGIGMGRHRAWAEPEVWPDRIDYSNGDPRTPLPPAWEFCPAWKLPLAHGPAPSPDTDG